MPDTFTSDMAMTDSVIHEIDTIRWLFDQEVVATTVVASKPSPLAAARLRDPQLVLFELTDGAVIDVEVFVNCRYGYDVRCEVVGSEGTVSMDNPSTNSLLRAAAGPRRSRPTGGCASTWPTSRRCRSGSDGLAKGVVGGPSSWDGYAAAVVASCAVHSLTEGSRVLVEQVDRPALYR